MKLETAQAWFGSQFPQQALRAFVVASSAPHQLDAESITSDSLREINSHGRVRGFDDTQRLVAYERVVCLFLTDGHLIVSSVGGALRVKPKDHLHTFDRNQLRCEWFDDEQTGNRIRNWVFFLPNSQWMAVATGTKILGKEPRMAGFADTFLQQLDASATQIDWRNPPPA